MSEEISKTENLDNTESAQNRVNSLVKQFEMLSVEKGSRNALDISKFDKGQIDKLLDIFDKNEDNGFKFHTKRLEVFKDIKTLSIKSSTINQKTNRYVFFAAAGSLLITSLLILFFKEHFFLTWMSMIFSALGGAGLKDPISKIFKEQKVTDSLPDDSK